MIFVRYILIGVALYLIVRALTNISGNEDSKIRKPDQENSKASSKKVSKKVGEYIDYEELDK